MDDDAPLDPAEFFADEPETEYLIFPETFKSEVCRGFDSTFTARVLAERGFLKKSGDGKFSRPERTSDGKQRLYVVSSRILSAEPSTGIGVPCVTGVT